MKTYIKIILIVSLPVLAAAGLRAGGTTSLETQILNDYAEGLRALFSLAAALMVMVTGFWLGRKWLGKVD